MRCLVVVPLVLAACGDNIDVETPDTPDPEARCAPSPGPLPTTGAFLDPLAFDLEGCVEGGLETVPGRWFVRDPDSVFDFSYPKFEGDCTAGFRQSFTEDRTDESQVSTQWTWSDGTRLFTRFSVQFQGDQPFEFTSAKVYCRKADDTLTGISAHFDTDRGEIFGAYVGTRFGLKDSPAEGLEKIGELGTFGPNPEDTISGLNVWVEGTIAYVVGFAGLSIVDVSTPATPTLIKQVLADDINGGYNDVRVVRTLTSTVAYLSPMNFTDTEVLDVTDPENPTFLAPLPEYSHSVQLVDNGATKHLYLATYTEFVPKYDVSNPLVPLRLGAAEIEGVPTGVHDLTVDGNIIYANYTQSGMVALNVTAGLDNAVELGRVPTSYSHASWVTTTAGGKKIILHGDEGLSGTAADGAAFLRILDGDPKSPTYLSELSRFRTRLEVGIHNLQVVGDKLYISYYQDGIRIVDIADPTQPTEIAHFNTWDPETAFGGAFEGAVGVRPANGHVFVADIDRGLIILDETR